MAGARSFGAKHRTGRDPTTKLCRTKLCRWNLTHTLRRGGEAWAWRLVARLTFQTPHAMINVEAGRAGVGARRRVTPCTTVNVEASR